jgi:hypothetical protein
MTEDFIIEIHNRAFLFSKYRECARALRAYDDVSFSRVWTETTGVALEIAKEWKETSPAEAETFTNYLYTVPQVNHNYMYACEIIENGIIPLLHKYMHELSAIDVTEGKWRIQSSRSGFLNLCDCETRIYLHSLDDPMEEAIERAENVFEPQHSEVHIFGAGLGYAPYAIWEKSYKSAHIYVYESDPSVVSYAKAYGMLDYIEEGCLDIILNENKVELLDAFLRANSGINSLKTVSPWMTSGFNEDISQQLQQYKSNLSAARMFTDIQKVNYYKNLEKKSAGLSELKKHFTGTDYIVVAAGPSLDDNMSYLKESVGKKTIVAVNTVLKRLLKEGIKPDILCLADPTDGVFKHVDGVENQTGDIPFVYESVSYWKFVDVYKGQTYRALSADIEETKQEKALHPENVLSVTGTVTSLCVEVALYLGAKSIELIGADMAFPGEKLYAGADSAKIERKFANEYYDVPSNDGSLVSTVDTYVLFRKGLEKSIFANLGIEYRNLSEHGSYVAGTISGPWLKVIKRTELEKIQGIDDNNLSILIQMGAVLSGIFSKHPLNVATELNRGYSFTEAGKEEIIKLLESWISFAKELKDNRALIFLHSVVYCLRGDVARLVKMAEYAKDGEFSKETKFYYYDQILEKIKQGNIENDELKYATKGLKDAILQGYKDAYGDSVLTQISSGSRNKGLIYVFADSISVPLSSSNEEVLDKCIAVLGEGKNAVLFNTMENKTDVAAYEVFKQVEREAQVKISGNEIVYKGKRISFVDFENIMPCDDMILMVLQNIREQKPGKVICFSDGPMEWLAEEIINGA